MENMFKVSVSRTNPNGGKVLYASSDITGKGDIVSLRPDMHNPGDTVVFEIRPNDGYLLDSVALCDDRPNGAVQHIVEFDTEILPIDDTDESNTYRRVKFIMPEMDVKLMVTFKEIDLIRVQIPDDLAHELSDLLTKQTIRERLLMNSMDDMEKFSKLESMLMPVVSRIGAIQTYITEFYIPDQFKSDEYQWTYNGYDVDKDQIIITKIQ